MKHVPEGQETLSAAWVEYERLHTRLTSYLVTSEAEFGSLIEALGACWNMAENVQKASARLVELTGVESGGQSAAIRDSMLEGCAVFRKFLNQIHEVSRKLASTAQDIAGLRETSEHLDENLVPLEHIAFHFRLEASRLSPNDGASIRELHVEMRDVVNRMKHSCASQADTLGTILETLLAAARSVEQKAASYATKAIESEETVQRNLDLLLETPADLREVQSKASSLGAVVADATREAVKVLQGHDTIRQRLEHILGALAKIREDREDVPEHALLLQRQQAKNVLELIVNTGRRIERELTGVIGSARGITRDKETLAAEDEQVGKFEAAVDHLASLRADVAKLLAGEVKIGSFVLTKIDPVRELLSANSNELEGVARSMKMLALNVRVGAGKIPSARGINALGTWMSEAAEGVLELARKLNEQFGALSATLGSQVGAVTVGVQAVESSRHSLLSHQTNDSWRNSRRTEYEQVSRLSEEARQLQERTETLVQSLKFVDQGTQLFGELDATLNCFLTLYPKSDKPFDLAAASAGYTMREQHEVHATIGSDSQNVFGRLTEPAEGQDYGENVELF